MKLAPVVVCLLGLAGCSEAPAAFNDAGGATDLGTPVDVAVDAGVDAGAPVDRPAAQDVPPAPVDVGRPADVPAEVARRIAERPYRLVVPDENDPSRPAPLLILLHGYGATGQLQSLYFGITRELNTRGILYAIPDGTIDAVGRRFWNATEACCNFARTPLDDVGYLDAIIDDVSARYAVDPRRIFIMGHSNGGFMAHRMACERSTRIAAIVSLAGATFNLASQCTPTEAVSVLQVHGTADETIAYTGGTNAGYAYPSAATSVGRWATYNRCAESRTAGGNLDLDSLLEGDETRIERHDGCMGGAAELWSIQGGRHLPTLTPRWAVASIDWLMAHPKPAR